MARAFAIFFACTTAALAAALVLLIAPKFQETTRQERYDEDIVFPIKVFVSTKNSVAAKGTLSADWMAYKNNTYSFYCDSEECIVASVDQIGPKLVSSIDGPVTYIVKQWTNDGAVVAEGNNRCSRTTITLDRKTESVLWVETPINQTDVACKNADDSVRKVTLENSLYWRRQRQ
jgi:hypothetical protein